MMSEINVLQTPLWIKRGFSTSVGIPFLVVLLLAIFFGAAQPNFASFGNFANIAIQASYLAIFALAQTSTMIVRGFDLSLGTAVSLISVVSGMTMVQVAGAGGGPGLAILSGAVAGLSVGFAVGLVNGVCVTWLGLSPFVVTLATLNICLGFASSISGGFQIFNLPDMLNADFYQASLVGIPAPVLAASILLLSFFVVLNSTRFGRALYFIGSNPRAAVVAGLPVKRYVMTAYLNCSLLVACGALLLTARTGSGEPNLGGNLMLESIAAAVVGGASLRGGRGSVLSPLVGALLITVLSNGMDMTRIDGYIQQMILGMVIIATVLGDAFHTGTRS